MAPTADRTPDHAVLLNTAEAARELGVSRSRIRQFVLEGRLPRRKPGRDLLVSLAELEPLRARRPGRPWPQLRHPAARRRRQRAG